MLSTLWLTDSLISNAVIVGTSAMRRGDSTGRAAGGGGGGGVGVVLGGGGREGVGREDLGDHSEAVRLVGVEGVARQQQLLGLAWTELPRMAEVLDAAHAEASADDVGEPGVFVAHDEVTRPQEHESCGVDVA